MSGSRATELVATRAGRHAQEHVSARAPGGSLHLAGGDPVGLCEIVGYSLAVALASLRMARRHRQLHGYVPWLLVPMVAVIAWDLQQAWVLPVGLLVVALAVYVPSVVPRLLAWSGVRGRVLLYVASPDARASVTLRVRRADALRLGPRYLELWNLASVPTAGRTPPADRTVRAGWQAMERAVAVARSVGLDVRLRSSTAALAAGFYVPLGFEYKRVDRPGRKPRMILRVPRLGVDVAGLARLRVLVDQAADELQVPRPRVTVDLDQRTPNAQAARSGRADARLDASPALTAAPAPVQHWFAAHEVGHLHLGVRRPVRTALTGRAALACYQAAAVVLWTGLAVLAPGVVPGGPSLLFVGLVAVLVVVLCVWAACSQVEEYAADRLAARVLLAYGLDPVQGTRAVTDQSWFGPRGPGVMARFGTHPTAERRLARVEQVKEQDAVRPA